MIVSLIASLFRVVLFWYILGLLVLFLGDPAWAEAVYRRLSLYPGIPAIELKGLHSALAVQINLMLYWTLPVLLLSIVAMGVGGGLSYLRLLRNKSARCDRLKARGDFWGVYVASYSMGSLPEPTVPKLIGSPLVLPGRKAGDTPKKGVAVALSPELTVLFEAMTPEERELCEELLQLLNAHPDHYAGQGHGVGLLAHTLNVVSETAARCTPEFRWPLIAALAHDIGKLITFIPDGKGGWMRKGLHSREGLRIMVTLPAYQKLPEADRDALMLAIKYDHAPSKMPLLRGSKTAHAQAMRIINALSQADRAATAAEKDRHLERLQPEDLLWLDFVQNLRDAPIVQRGAPGKSNQINNPEGEFIFLYEAPWRDAAVRRLPAEVAAALDLTRRDAGKLAKYTRYLVARLKKEGILLETHGDLAVSEGNPLWDIQSGTGEKATVLRGVLVLKKSKLWSALNYKIGTLSPYKVTILAPNANSAGVVNDKPKAKPAPPEPAVSDQLKLAVGDESGLGLVTSGDDLKPFKARPGRNFGPAQDKPVPGLVDAKPVRSEPTPQEQPPSPAEVPEAQGAHAPEVKREPVLAQSEIPTDIQDAAEPTLVSASAAASLAMALLSTPEPMLPEEGGEEGHGWEEPTPDEGAPPEAAQPAAEEEVVPPALESKPEPAPEPKPEAPPPASKAPAAAPISAKLSTSAPHAPAIGSGAPAHGGLSRSESKAGIAIADAEACQRFPHLKPGDKYHTEVSKAQPPGTRFTAPPQKGAPKAAPKVGPKPTPGADAFAQARRKMK